MIPEPITLPTVVDIFLLLLIGIGPKLALVPFLKATAGMPQATKRLVWKKMLTTAHDAAEGPDLGAALRDHAPIDLVPDHGAEGPPQLELAELRQEPCAADAGVADGAEQAGVEANEKGKEDDRERKVGGHPSRRDRDRRHAQAHRSADPRCAGS